MTTEPTFEDPRSLADVPDEAYEAERRHGLEATAAELASWGPLLEATHAPEWPTIRDYFRTLHDQAMEGLLAAATIERVAAMQSRVSMLRDLMSLPELVVDRMAQLRAKLEELNTDVTDDEGDPDA